MNAQIKTSESDPTVTLGVEDKKIIIQITNLSPGDSHFFETSLTVNGHNKDGVAKTFSAMSGHGTRKENSSVSCAFKATFTKPEAAIGFLGTLADCGFQTRELIKEVKEKGQQLTP